MPSYKIEQAQQSDADALALLIYAAGPDNLNSVFSGHCDALTGAQRQKICVDYLTHALQAAEGQFGYQNQYVIRHDSTITACVSYWVKPMSKTFRQATLESLLVHFNSLDSALILQSSLQLAQLVQAPDTNSMSIGHLAVKSDHRRQGRATALLDFCEQQARLLGKSSLILDLSATNEIALKAYQAYGFAPIRTTEPSPEGLKLGLGAHIHMRKPLL